MARNENKSKSTQTPDKELVLKVTLPNGNEVTLGRVGLFTENNNLHAQVAEMNDERLATLLTKLTATVVEYGENKGSKEIDLGF